MKKQTAGDLAKVNFPRCAEMCLAIKHLGAGECEFVCPHKFK